MWLRELFNDHRWHHGDLDQLEIVVRHRGAPDEERTVSGAAVRDIGPAGLLLDEEVDADGTGFIPYHRVLRVVARDGAVLWSRATAEGEGE